MVINMMPGSSMSSSTNIKLPLSFIIFGIVTFVLAHAILLFGSDFLSIGQFRVPLVWSGAHFLLLEFAVMICMGAMYQLVPVAFLTPIWNQTFGIFQFIVTVIGFITFAVLLGLNVPYAVYGGMIAVIGVLMFIFQMFKTLTTQKEKNIMSYFVMGALTALTLAIIAGFILVWNLSFSSIVSQEHLIFALISLVIAGCFTLLLFGFSDTLIPIFSLSHGLAMKWAKPAFFPSSVGLLI